MPKVNASNGEIVAANLPAVPEMEEATSVTRGLPIRNVSDLMEMAKIVSQSGLAPRGMDKPEQCFIAMQVGMESGLTPMASLSSVVVINGVPSWRGKSALALVRRSGKMKQFDWGFSGEGDDRHHWIESQRIDEPNAHRTEFSVADAKRAGLWGKQGPWTQYPQRMMRWRCVGFHLADHYSDVTHGLTIAEEVIDYPASGRGDAIDTSKPPPVDPLLSLGKPDSGTTTAPDATVESRPPSSPPKKKVANKAASNVPQPAAVEKIELPPSLVDDPDPDMF